MRKISFVNFCLLILILCSLIFIVTVSCFNDEIPSTVKPKQGNEKRLPKNSFQQPEEAVHAIGKGPLSLSYQPLKMELPDLKDVVMFYGKSKRPDTSEGVSPLYLGLKGTEESVSIGEGKRLYLVYQGAEYIQNFDGVKNEQLLGTTTTAGKEPLYLFSPENQPTSLWLDAKLVQEGKSVAIKVSLLDEKGMIVTTPESNRQFTLSQSGWQQTPLAPWEIGSLRVDTSLLIRQKAKWCGKDLFLQIHGGDDYAHSFGKERVDFFACDDAYSCFVSEGDFLIWKNNRWQIPDPRSDTKKYNLLFVKKIDDKLLSFELWDPPGRRNINLNLLRTKDPQGIPSLSGDFTFIGAKTWAQFIVEYHGGRTVLRPGDWLVLTPEGWHILDNETDVDNYVSGKLAGPLFVIEKMSKEEGRGKLVGHIFNSNRTEVEAVVLPQASGSIVAKPVNHPIPKNLRD